ncbi:MAG: inorganic pyrophosphatase, partial [Chloroflexi bacterium]|nr:inorganic pyrophosphatase [Chloroflexota bacterium]
PNPPALVSAYIEITPFDPVKYEIDKVTGYLRVDRPQVTSSQPPTLYGFIPRTYCGEHVAALMPGAQKGDGDPLDICVISERPITHAEVILTARVVGCLKMLDSGDADDKIVAVLERDAFWGELSDISELPEGLVNRLSHYFSTYKMIPGQESRMHLVGRVGAEEAQTLVRAAMQDYNEAFGGPV